MLRRRTSPRTRRIARAAAAACLALLPAMPPAWADEVPVVVELYTSQGCSSCPAADEYFGELAREPGIIALGFHVDYWNYLGWSDPFSSKKFTYRQKEYSMSFRLSGVYTPQMVIQGRRGEVGSNRKAVARAIADMRALKPLAMVTIAKRDGAGWRAAVVAAEGVRGAEIWLAVFDHKHTTKVPRGENEGKVLVDHNVVRFWRKIGEVSGERAELDLPIPAAKGVKRGAAVIVQGPKAGQIYGAGKVDLD